MNASQIKILVTGARGFIGRALLPLLAKIYGGSSIHAIKRRHDDPVPPVPGVTWHSLDLLDTGAARKLIDIIKPTHILHAAWEARPPHFWTSDDNRRWVKASIELTDHFVQSGGKRFLSIGSLAEYDIHQGRMIEHQTPEIPTTLYGQSKLDFHRHLLMLNKERGFSAAIGRVFYVYGPFELPSKLVASACHAIAMNRVAEFGPLDLWRDYLHIDDLARAIITLFGSSLQGVVNLGSSEPVRQSTLIETLAKISGRDDLFKIGARPANPHEPPILFADTKIIRSLGWKPEIAREEGLATTLQWWRAQHRRAA